MDKDVVLFQEANVCDGGAWTLHWGTLQLRSGGFIYYYNRPRKDAPGRMQDVINISDVVEVSSVKIDWLVSKVFWVGRRLVVIRTREGEKRYYLRDTAGLFSALRFLTSRVRVVP